VTLLERCVDTLHGYFELGNETDSLSNATAVRSSDCPSVYDANCVTRIRAAEVEEVDGLLAEADEAFAALAHRCYKLDPFTPAPFVARLVLDGYEPTVELQLLLEGELEASPLSFDIRAVLSAEDWSATAALMRMDHEESAVKAGRECWAPAVTAQLVEQKKRKAPAVQFFVARADGVDCAFFSSWPGINGVGKVEDLFTMPSFRRRGLATSLIAQAVADARERGAESVLIGADPADTPKSMYAALGFRPLMIYTSYVRTDL
jgi:GNAT superfamily N-acetyltransferase